MNEIKITVEIGGNLHSILEQMLKEIRRYPGSKETTEGFRVMGEILEKLLKQSTEGVKRVGYYDGNWLTK